MDQGVSAVIAGLAGLVGAVFGGMTTAYGARVGAQKTIEAVHAQADRQSISEHQQWVREQRRLACVSFIDAFGVYALATSKLSTAIEEGNDIHADSAMEASGAHRALVVAKGHSQLWGPDSLNQAAHRVTRATAQLLSVIGHWHASYDEISSDRKAELQRQCLTANEELKQARWAYVEAAQFKLSLPPSLGGQ
ncbi:hypothetical protein [Streptomyces europaeiscabiei]|uniref:hypothetical protein n=1 Tax=Streptomyces europaeiscabiei TaxID=146819 RepID=UPI002E12F815|nr:hypothetical protein OHB30_35470 [Streptomyces europaeiscabiei]